MFYSTSIENKKRYNASLAQQFRWLLWRNFISDMRTPISTKILVIQTLFIGIFFGLIYLQLDLDETGVGNTNGLLFILMMNVGFIFLFPILNVISEFLKLLKLNKQKQFWKLNRCLPTKCPFFIEITRTNCIPLLCIICQNK